MNGEVLYHVTCNFQEYKKQNKVDMKILEVYKEEVNKSQNKNNNGS